MCWYVASYNIYVVHMANLTLLVCGITGGVTTAAGRGKRLRKQLTKVLEPIPSFKEPLQLLLQSILSILGHQLNHLRFQKSTGTFLLKRRVKHQYL